MRSCTGAQTSFAPVVRIVAEVTHSSPIFANPNSPANANGSPSSTV